MHCICFHHTPHHGNAVRMKGCLLEHRICISSQFASTDSYLKVILLRIYKTTFEPHILTRKSIFFSEGMSRNSKIYSKDKEQKSWVPSLHKKKSGEKKIHLQHYTWLSQKIVSLVHSSNDSCMIRIYTNRHVLNKILCFHIRKKFLFKIHFVLWLPWEH